LSGYARMDFRMRPDGSVFVSKRTRTPISATTKTSPNRPKPRAWITRRCSNKSSA